MFVSSVNRNVHELCFISFNVLCEAKQPANTGKGTEGPVFHQLSVDGI